MFDAQGRVQVDESIETAVDAYSKQLLQRVMQATRLSNSLIQQDLPFIRVSDQETSQALDSLADSLLFRTNQVLAYETLITKPLPTTSNSASQRFQPQTLRDLQRRHKQTVLHLFQRLATAEDILEDYASVMETMDSVMESIDRQLDLARPHKYAKQQSDTLSQLKSKPMVANVQLENGKQISLFHAENIVRPQLLFKEEVDNTNGKVWHPKLQFKWHAMVPFNNIPDDLKAEQRRTLNSISVSPNHPYDYEIQQFATPELLVQDSPVFPWDLESTPCEWIDEPESLQAMIEHLKQVQEFAMDLEHHNYRSFTGFVCLMQISTRQKDFIIDCLKLRNELQQLNCVTTNPKIVKILHGAESDVIWLQRDFGVYLVALFDTYFASKILTYPALSLAFLMEQFCHISPDKSYQLADWRMRPLPEAMFRYAQSDTHYLIYIYECLKQSLNVSQWEQVWQLSRDQSRRIYEPDVYTTESWRVSYLKQVQKSKSSSNSNSNSITLQTPVVYRYLHEWRDSTARQEDESPAYVCSNAILFQLAKFVPNTLQAVIQACGHQVPPLVRQRSEEILLAVKTALKQMEKEKLEKLEKLEIEKLDNLNEEKQVQHLHFDEAELEQNDELKVMKESEKLDNEIVENNTKQPLIQVSTRSDSLFLIQDSNPVKSNDKIASLLASLTEKMIQLPKPIISNSSQATAKEPVSQVQHIEKQSEIQILSGKEMKLDQFEMPMDKPIANESGHELKSVKRSFDPLPSKAAPVEKKSVFNPFAPIKKMKK